MTHYSRPRHAQSEPGGPKAAEEAYMFPLRNLLGVVWRWWWFIAVVAVAFQGLVMGFSFGQPRVYEASATILVGQDQALSEEPANVVGLQALATTMASTITTRTVAEGVVERLNLGIDPQELLLDLEAEQVPGTQIIEIRYRDSDPERAQRVTNAVGATFSEEMSEFQSSTEGDDGSDITVGVWESAAVPEQSISPRPLRNGLAAFVAGAFVGVFPAFYLEYLSRKPRKKG